MSYAWGVTHDPRKTPAPLFDPAQIPLFAEDAEIACKPSEQCREIRLNLPARDACTVCPWRPAGDG